MKKRRLLAICLLSSALLWAFTTARAQDDMIVSNLSELVAEAYSGEHCFYLPFIPLPWRAWSLDGSQPWFLDCSEIDCTNLLVSPTNLDSGATAYGVLLTKNFLTGETILQPQGSTDVVATVEPPSGYVFGASPDDAMLYRFWSQLTNCPDCYGIDGEVPPPVLMLQALLASASDYAAYAAYESNLEAQAATSATAMTMSGGFMAMGDDDDGGDDPCTLTNLLQAFAVTNITQTANGISITFQSCQFFRYLIFTASQLTSNTVWFPQAYVWGTPGHSSTTWTDSATTNSDGSTVTQRFYRVQRLLGSPIAAGSDFSVVLTQDGKLWAWGDNGGELGDGLGGAIDAGGNTVEAYLPYPGEVANVIPCAGQAITNAVAVAAGGDDFTVVADANGTVWTFGENDGAQLGNGIGPCFQCGINSPTPAPITGVNNVVAVAAGYQYALALRSDGRVFAWGNNTDKEDVPGDAEITGQLGICCTKATNVPVESQFPTGVVIVAIAAGSYHSVALDTGGNVWTFGDNESGQLGNGVNTCVSNGNAYVAVPTMLTTISNVIAIAAGDQHTVALRADKTLWTWGSFPYGQLGRSENPQCDPCCIDPTPGQVVASGLSNNVVAIAAGTEFTLAVTSNGQVYAFGDNSLGELGTVNIQQTEGEGGIESTNVPILVAGISNVVLVSAPLPGDGTDGSGMHALVMTLDQGTNHYWGFGDNTLGEIGNATTSGNGTNSENGDAFVSTPTGPVQFCTRCQRCVQLGTGGVFTAQCNGTLYLYFNTDNFGACAGQYNVTFGGQPTNVPANADCGVPVGTVTNGQVCTFTASGACLFQSSAPNTASDANGNATTNGVPWDCSDFTKINMTNAVCPAARCFSLVGRIQ